MRRIDTPDELFLAGDPSTNTKGTPVRYWWLNALQEEVAGVVEGLGGTLDPNNNGQLLERLLATFADKGDLLLNAPIHFVAGGTGDSITGTLDPAITAYPVGLRVRCTPVGTNTSSTPKINLNGLGEKTIVKRGLGGLQPLTVEEWNSYSPIDLECNGTYFILLGIAFDANVVDNVIINGGFTVDQDFEFASGSITAGAARAHVIDKWLASCAGANVACQSQDSSLTTMSNRKFVFTGAPGVTAINFQQRIATRIAGTIAGRDCFLRVRMANSLLSTVTWRLNRANSVDNFTTETNIASGTFTVNSGMAEYQIKIPTTNECVSGMSLEFEVGAQTSGTWEIGDVKLGVNNKKFEPRKYEDELDDCLFYYWASPITSVIGVHFGVGQAYNTTDVYFPIRFPRKMRATPTLTVSAAGHFQPYLANGNTTNSFTNIAGYGQTPEHGKLICQGSASLVAGNASVIVNSSASARIYANARL